MKRLAYCHIALSLILVLSFTASAQEETSLIEGKSNEQLVKDYHWMQNRLNDWPNFNMFRDENAMIAAPKPGESRVVFMGNSITQGWSDASPEFFEGKPYIERGISGQTTPQMLVRFRADVVDLMPKVVVILAGTNDVAGNTGPATNEMIQDNLASMAEIASANGIKVVLSSILPVYDYPWRRGLNPSQRIIDINSWMKRYCEEHGHIYLDYFSSMVDDRNGMDSTYTYDGVHANKAGYTLMESLVEPAIQKALEN